MSLVIPVYNAAGFIAENMRSAAMFLRLLEGPNELIVVDDASTDGSSKILQEMAPNQAGVSFTLLRNDRNRGKGYSVRRGMRVARGRHLIFNDADFTYPVEEVGIFSHYLDDGHDVVIGSRMHPDSKYVISPKFIRYLYTRHVMSRIFNFMVNVTLGLGIRDTQAGIKGFEREAGLKIFERHSLNRFSFDLELLFIARKMGLKIAEVPVHFFYKKEPTTIRFSKDSLIMLYDIARIRWRSLMGKYR